MISQRINLFQDRFREKKLWVSGGQLAFTIVCLLVTVVVWSYLLEAQLREARQFSVQIKHDREQLDNELNAANKELVSLLADTSLDLEIQGLGREINARRRVINFVESNQFGSGDGFSFYLSALSNLHLSDVWLDEISLSDNYIRIRGSALNAELVPAYFSRFSQEVIFQGNRFDIFQLDRKDSSNWKVDFEIATRLDLHE